MSRGIRHLAEHLSEILGELFSCFGTLLAPHQVIEHPYVLGISSGNKLLLSGMDMIDISRDRNVSKLFGLNHDEVVQLYTSLPTRPFWLSNMTKTLESRPSCHVRLWDGSITHARYPLYAVIDFFIDKHVLANKPRRIAPHPRLLPLLEHAVIHLLDLTPNIAEVRHQIFHSRILKVEGLVPVDVLGLLSANSISKARLYATLLGAGFMTDAAAPLGTRIELSSLPQTLDAFALQSIWNSYYSRLSGFHAKVIKAEETFQRLLGLLLEQFSKVVVLEMPVFFGDDSGRVDIVAIKDGYYYYIEVKNIPLHLLLIKANVDPFNIKTFADISKWPHLHQLWYRTKFDPTKDHTDPDHKCSSFKLYCVDQFCDTADRQVRGYMEKGANGMFQPCDAFQMDPRKLARPGQLKYNPSRTWPMYIRGLIAVSLGGAAFLFKDVVDKNGVILQYTTNIHFTFEGYD
ncbi:hypothetical protein D9757_014831 [Collybiopsis confluens]|uniref:Uncharacterized protein n=1 Tax=Collybiopsis confluens TaxID=2823264 RepID=A0A8H5GE55_9AGAR|nr:hypothetical protein D9757_014831 [Collybiopsis confluens]